MAKVMLYGVVLTVTGAGSVRAQAPDPAKVAAGKTVFADTKCSKCHGPEGRGDRAGKMSLVGTANKLSAAEIRNWITNPAEMTAKLPKKPKEPMKKFDLTAEQVDSLVAYVESLKK
jgi:mono/diheme cytochrome c family protein